MVCLFLRGSMFRRKPAGKVLQAPVSSLGTCRFLNVRSDFRSLPGSTAWRQPVSIQQRNWRTCCQVGTCRCAGGCPQEPDLTFPMVVCALTSTIDTNNVKGDRIAEWKSSP